MKYCPHCHQRIPYTTEEQAEAKRRHKERIEKLDETIARLLSEQKELEKKPRGIRIPFTSIRITSSV